MRPTVEPPPSTKCNCGGELRLKQIHQARRELDFAVNEVFVCAQCGSERTFIAKIDRYAAITHHAAAK